MKLNDVRHKYADLWRVLQMQAPGKKTEFSATTQQASLCLNSAGEKERKRHHQYLSNGLTRLWFI